MRPSPAPYRHIGLAVCALVVLVAALPAPARAQEFGLVLRCEGQVTGQGRQRPAHLDLALRRNNSTALIQRSDVLPVGERLQFDTSQAFYSLVFKVPRRDSSVYHHWWSGALFIWNPDLLKLHTVRLSIDRQTAALAGELQDVAERSLGRLAMKCTPQSEEDAPEPKF